MNCPLCTDQALRPHRRGGIEIDVCPHCHGIWLDRGELERLVADDPATPPAIASTTHPSEWADERSPKKAKKDKGSRKKRLGERLGDLLEDALDL